MQSLKSKILYIDDDELNLESFRLLYEEDFEIYMAYDAEEALKILEKIQVKVIVSDQRMPGMSGVELFSKLIDIYPDPVRILLTGFADFEMLKKAINMGRIYSYVNKPFDVEQFRILLLQATETYDLRIKNKQFISQLELQNDELMQSEERLKHITETVSDYIYTLCVENNKLAKLDHTIKCKSLTGYDKSDFENDKDLWFNIVHPDDQQIFKRELSKCFSETGVFQLEHRIVRKDSEVRWVYHNIKRYQGCIKDNCEYNGVIKDITVQYLFRQKMLETIIETEENERRRFAGDLHDELGPQLASMRIYLSSLKKRATNNEQVEIIEEVMGLISNSIENVRELSYNISPHLLETYGLVAALEAEIERKKDIVSIGLVKNIENERFDKKLEISVYRIVKELLNNSIKYSQATEIKINVKFENNSLHLDFKDNGIGFDYDELMSRKHRGIGLMNIQSRVNSLNGQSIISSSQGQGFQFSMNIETLIVK